MKILIRTEEAAMFILATTVLFYMSLPWWIYILLLLGPDISMLGYLAGNKAGALSYNIFHHKGLALVIAAIGYLYASQLLLITGILLFGHSSLDRMFGYGLKYFSGFSDTHLGFIGKNRQEKTGLH
ncbi:MAG: DUF4260 domain-containing protein [Ferruginibacter sp.]